MSKEFGLYPQNIIPKMWWGARAIITRGDLDIPWDRKSFDGDSSDTDDFFYGKLRIHQERLHTYIIGRENIPQGWHVDHINHIHLDNRRSNLRVVPPIENLRNRKGKNKNNTSGYRNVLWDKTAQKWSVVLCKNYKSIYIGKYDDLEEAAKAAEAARREYYGEHCGGA